MSRSIIRAVSLSLLLNVANASSVDGETVADTTPPVDDTVTHPEDGNYDYIRPPLQWYQPRGTHVVSHSIRFPGSYFAENGEHYHQPSQPGGRAEIVERGAFAHVDDLAQRLEYETRMMCREMAANHRDEPNYPPMYREAYRIWELAKQIQKGRGEADRAEVSSLVRDLDSRFQLVRREVRGWSSRQQNQRGAETLPAKVERAEAVIHHLWNDVGPRRNAWVARKDVDAPRLQAPENARTVWK